MDIPPLVYAQDLSFDGVIWNGFRMGKENGIVLLSDDDILQISPGIYVQFRSPHRVDVNVNCFNNLQQKEILVSFHLM